jgi:PAS domain S-box-containing protein
MIRILHVDDEVEFLDLVGFFLKREGDFEVGTATTAELALEKMQSDNYDAVVADYSLPGMDGVELLKILRAKGLQIPFILFTGRGKEETAIEALNCGADFYLQKGANPQLQVMELVNMLRKSVHSGRSDAAAREGERFLSSVFSSIQDGISVLDKDLNILRVNEAVEDWYSHKMPLVGKKCYDAYHGRQARCDSCPSMRSIESGKSAYEVVPRIGPESEITGWLDLYSFPMRDSKTGKLSGVIEYVRDITDRRKAETALHDALERSKALQEIIDRSPVIMATWLPEPGAPVSFISDNVAQWGYTKDDFASALVYNDIIHKEDLEREDEEFWDFVGKGANDFLQEYRIVTKSGEVRWVEDHTYVRRDSDGNPVLFEGIVIDVTARKTAQQKSEELASRLQAITEAIPDLYFHIDAHGTILDFNAGHIADLYVPPQKFLGRKVQEIHPPDIGKMFVGAYGEVMKTGRVVSMEYSLEIEDETRFFEARLAPIAEDQVLIVVRNVTARKRAEEALLKSEGIYRQVVDSAAETILILQDGMIKMVNEMGTSMSGFSEQELLSKPFTTLIHPDDLAMVGERHQRRLRGEVVPNRYDFRVLAKDGSTKWVTVSAAATQWEGRPATLNLLTDITERRLAEETLRASEEKYRQLVELAQEGILMTDADAVVRFANPKMADMLGHNVDELVGKPLFQFLNGRAAELARGKFEDRRQGLVGLHDFDFLRNDGTLIRVSMRSTPIKDKDGVFLGSLAVVTDIADRKRYEEALEDANQKLNLLGQVTRHDALNQLAVLMGWLQIAQESVAEPPVQEYLKNMRTAAETVIRQLEFTGDYQKVGIAKPEWIDVKTAFFNGAVGFSTDQLAMSVHVDGLEVYADMMFEKIFHNLIDNSIRHGKKVTEIRLHYKKKENGVSLVYEDDGVGVPVDEKNMLFLRGSGKHTGFGLFVVCAILEITGITIEENGIPGHGVRFEMHVPSNGFRVRDGAESQKR